MARRNPIVRRRGKEVERKVPSSGVKFGQQPVDQENVKLILELPGARRGITRRGPNGKFTFTNGRLELLGTEKQWAGLISYLGKCYGVRVVREAPHGDGQDQTSSPGKTDGGSDAGAGDAGQQHATAPGGVQPKQSGSAGASADDRRGDVVPQTGGPGPAASGGRGHGNAGDAPTAPTLKDRLRLAIQGLDPEVDGHWTGEGKPSNPHLEKVLSYEPDQRLSRRAVEDAAPRYDRLTARGMGPRPEESPRG